MSGATLTAPSWDEFWNSQNRVLLAPMEGVVDAVMRDMITKIGGVDLCVTEFIRVTDRLLPLSDFKKYAPELFSSSKTPAGTPVLIQFLGGQPGPMAENAAFAASLGAPGIDLNFGCPAKTVNRHDGGAALLRDPSRIFDVVSAVRAAVPTTIPVSAKVRLGFENKDRHLEIAKAAEAGGAKWLTVHARTRDEGYRPPAHWEYIARMREAVSIPVIANGEVWTLEDYKRCREVSGCRHVMIGRGLMSAPDLAKQIQTGAAQTPWSEVLVWLIDFGLKSREYRHDHYAVCRVKQWLKSLAKTYLGVAELFERLKTQESLDPMLAILRESSTHAVTEIADGSHQPAAALAL